MRHFRPLALAITALLCLLGTAEAAAIYDPGTGRFMQRDPSGYPDGMNSYAGYHSLLGGVDPSGLGPVKGNKYGNWNIAQTNTDAPVPGKQYSSTVTIIFYPNAEAVCFTKIAYIQVGKVTSAKTGKPMTSGGKVDKRLTPSGWAVDGLDGFPHPWYNLDENGNENPKWGIIGSAGPGLRYRAAVMTDTPEWNLVLTRWEFQAYVICMEGKDKNKLYAGITWGFDVDNRGKLTSHDNKHLNKPTNAAIGAGLEWNSQANGPEEEQNAPGQVPISLDTTWDGI